MEDEVEGCCCSEAASVSKCATCCRIWTPLSRVGTLRHMAMWVWFLALTADIDIREGIDGKGKSAWGASKKKKEKLPGIYSGTALGEMSFGEDREA